MAESSRTFNFDDFDDQIREALEGNDEAMQDVPGYKKPGEVGGVMITGYLADANLDS